MKRIPGLGMVLLAGFLSPAVLSAQSFWLDQPGKAHVTLEYLRPDFKAANDGLRTFAAFLSMRYPIGRRTSLVAEIPYSYWRCSYSYDFGYGSYSVEETEKTAGNPYVGLEMGGKEERIYTELGVRLPLTPYEKWNANLLGCLIDFTRAEAFVPDWLPVSAMLNLRNNVRSGLAYRLRAGPVLWFYTGSNNYSDQFEWWLNYSAQIGFETDRFLIRASIAGRLNASVEGAAMDERTMHHLGISAALHFGGLWPGIYVVRPLDADMQEFIRSVVGLNLCVELD